VIAITTSSEGAALSALQIAKHGHDRYPTPHTNAEKVVVEAAELLGAISNHERGLCGYGPLHDLGVCPPVRDELADVGLCLYALGNKLQIDPIDAMRDLVDRDHRSFREHTEDPARIDAIAQYHDYGPGSCAR
jgi:NTP pyrophosphatase (non-canonical NTP hydrolase)